MHGEGTASACTGRRAAWGHVTVLALSPSPLPHGQFSFCLPACCCSLCGNTAVCSLLFSACCRAASWCPLGQVLHGSAQLPQVPAAPVPLVICSVKSPGQLKWVRWRSAVCLEWVPLAGVQHTGGHLLTPWDLLMSLALSNLESVPAPYNLRNTPADSKASRLQPLSLSFVSLGNPSAAVMPGCTCPGVYSLLLQHGSF